MHRAEANADASKSGYKRKLEGYEKQLKSLSQSISALQRDRLADADKIRRQAIISDQLQHEMARTIRTEGGMKNMLEEYKKEFEKELNALLEEAHRMRTALPSKEEEAAALVEELRETRDKMKWVMAQKKRQQNGE
jgi:chromosome segregation ATPase